MEACAEGVAVAADALQYPPNRPSPSAPGEGRCQQVQRPESFSLFSVGLKLTMCRVTRLVGEVCRPEQCAPHTRTSCEGAGVGGRG